MRLDGDMQRVLDRFAGQLPAAQRWDVAVRRRLMLERSPWLAGPREPVAEVRDVTLATEAGNVRGRLFDPNGAPDLPLMVFAHGGCWNTGDLDTHDALCRSLALRGGCLVLAVDYRRAPEHPFPAALDDMEGVLGHLLAGRHLGSWDGRRVLVAGDSAGGTLAATLAQRHRGGVLAGQLLIYPILDLASDSASYARYGTGLTLSADEMAWSWDLYCPDPASRTGPEVSPLQANDLTDLPPSALVIAEYDLLADEDREYVRALRAAGNTVETILGARLAHGFIRMGGQVAAVDAVLDRCGAFLRRVFRS
jgi:acetyl esterase